MLHIMWPFILRSYQYIVHVHVICIYVPSQLVLFLSKHLEMETEVSFEKTTHFI